MPLKKVSNESAPAEYKREEILPVKAAQQPMIQWVISEPKYTLNDLILDAETTAQLLDVISYFKNRELLFQCWGLSEKFFSQSSMAVNLYGPPGTGKTVAAHAVVHELQSKMISVTASRSCWTRLTSGCWRRSRRPSAGARRRTGSFDGAPQGWPPGGAVSSGMGSAHAAGSVFLQLREAALTAVL